MPAATDPSPFLQSVREAIRVRHLSIRTEEAYVHWIRRFILFHGKRHPAQLAEAEATAFLSNLATDRRAAAATQGQALAARLFLYKQVLGAKRVCCFLMGSLSNSVLRRIFH
jgi:Phage integrase, N-terminal SAM-like domain